MAKIPEKLTIPIPAVGFHPPVYICQRAKMPACIDGKLDKPFWEAAEFTELFIDIEGEKKPEPRFRTKAKLLWDDTYLYIGAILEGDEIWATLTERDCVIFNDNDFEIFIDPDSDTQQYYEYEMNAFNTVWDLLLTKAYRDGGKAVNCYDMHGLKTAVSIDGRCNDPDVGSKSWSVEIAIPFAAVTECAERRGAPEPGEYFRMNFSRVQWLVDRKDGRFEKRLHPKTQRPYPEDNWVWAPTGVINIHYPELWAFVFFSDGETDCAISEDEYRKWELRKLYYAEKACMDLSGTYTSDMEELKKILSDWSPVPENRAVKDCGIRVETTMHGFELSCPTADGRASLVLDTDGKVSRV